MTAADWIGIALVGLLAVAAVAIIADFVRTRVAAHATKRTAADVEQMAKERGGWWVIRNNTVYHLESDDAFVAACREGRVYPTDQVFTRQFDQWIAAVDIREPRLVFAAETIRSSWPPPPSFGCVGLLLLIWVMSAVEKLEKPLSTFMPASRAGLIAAVVQLLSIAVGVYYGWRYFFSSRGVIPRSSSSPSGPG